jgi:Pyruvate/2-oxoacid:ferredoxin oxidoreductase delta subunit
MKFRFPSLIRPSTRRFIREARQADSFSFFDLLHGYIYGRFPYLYISLGTGRHPLARAVGPVTARLVHFLTTKLPRMAKPAGAKAEPASKVTFADTYHGKVVPLEAATQLVKVQEEIRITNLEKVVPYARARDIILQNPDHIVALDCPCRAAQANPCLPMDVCLVIGEPFASFITDHQPNRSRWISQGEAEEILKAENKRGHVHHAFFKDAMLGRFYAICNCCDCCCGAMKAHRNGTPMLASSGFLAVVDAALCRGCEKCARLCQFHAITISHDGAKLAQIHAEKCMGCGICANACSRHAIELVREPTLGEPLEIQKLMQDSMR